MDSSVGAWVYDLVKVSTIIIVLSSHSLVFRWRSLMLNSKVISINDNGNGIFLYYSRHKHFSYFGKKISSLTESFETDILLQEVIEC